ncbi:MAG: cation-translocating P-type ATPase [Planctomycetaceae bacterium]
MNPPAIKPHAVAADALLQHLETDAAHGLSDAAVAARRERFGANELQEAPPVAWWRRLLAQFRDLVVWILIVAAIISGATHDLVDMFVILAIVLLNGLIGFFQEQRAEQALAALRKLSAPAARVVRDGIPMTIPARELVPGDRIELEAGDNVPADARLVEAFGLRVQEAALTGESAPAEKDAACVLPDNTSLGDRRNMVYLSTVVAAGKGRAVVTTIGMETELGRIAGLLQHEDQAPTPLQRRLAELGRVLVVVCLVIVGIIFALEMYRGGKLADVFIRSISLAVAAVPEGLPAVVTLALALGLQRMVARHVLIRRLPSVETLGSVTVICSDKTGTLTRNEMTVRVVVAGGECFHVTGTGYAPSGRFLRGTPEGDEATGPVVEPRDVPALLQALSIGMRCNNARLVMHQGEAAQPQATGDPTELALLAAGLKAGLDQRPATEPILHEIPFDSDRKAMSVVLEGADGRATMFTKGAPEAILQVSAAELRDGRPQPLTDERRRELMQINSSLAGRALRVLALAYREGLDGDPAQHAEAGLTFAGLAGLIDPPREEAKAAVARCRQAGIRPVMITGDHPETAAAIARELGLAVGDDRVVSGRQLDGMSDEELSRQVEQVAVFARVSPEHKLRVVRAWQARGHIAAMTGDGVNDAPAVKAADIGIAMGISGTDVTKEASDMVLTDDNFTSIVNAVEEGRGIFDNIQKFVHYLLSCNAGEVLLMLFAALVGWPAPLEAIQILWINLVTDGLPALALAMERPEKDIMQRPPRPPREPVVNVGRGLLMLWHGVLVAAAAAAGFGWIYYDDGAALDRAQTVAFCIMSYSQLIFAIGCRSHFRTLFELGPFSNPHLLGAIAISGLLQLAVVTVPFAQRVFRAGTPAPEEWLLILLFSLAPVTIIEITKLVRAAGRRGESTAVHAAPAA